MSETATKLLEHVLQLSEAERATLADRLWESLSDEKHQELLSDEPEDPVFEAELARRMKEVDEHPERLLDGETVFAEVREHLRRKRKLGNGEQP